ncbi:polymorphic toxin-type HINT domain-containing protein [Couchioplanes azureus]|uniref:polymorphic toxin-type HINT domain-containing protein n=1 Tax=Couchioplanes caeruleus TaxID=56438 RepID=UPI001670F2DB|nr:polymorphic toxin-type HINT domain-containing protein [Couchioplanes caeruleus]
MAVGKAKTRDGQVSESQVDLWKAPAVQWPAADKSEVAIPDSGLVEVPGQPIRIGRPATASARAAGKPAARLNADEPVAQVESEVLGRDKAAAAGVTGLMLRLSRTDETAAKAPMSVEIDYSSLQHAFGGDWARRMQVVQLPACAVQTPAKEQCQAATPVPAKNDVAKSTVVADAQVPPAKDGQAMVLAVTAAAASVDTGTFARSSLTEAASWSAGKQSGDFSWSYPLQVPPAPGELEPELALGYSSGAVDGRTNANNAQPSWIGEGWNFEPGFIERQYRACRDDVTGATTAQYTNATDDLCYRDQNAVLSWRGQSTELVLDDATGKWRLAEDDGSYLELVTGGSGTGLYNNEHWKLTTPDGTQYWFGKSRLPGWQEGQPVTSSVWGVPVFANRTGEPCYKTGGFAGSYCAMAWRWNLDYVVDPDGNSMSYWYQKETSRTKLAGTATVAAYDRGGWLARIDYGSRSGSETSAKAPMKVDFTPGDRCLATCWNGSTPVTANWPDTPWDLQCNAAPCNNNPAPSFWTAKRLAKVTTSVLVAGAYTPVDEWALTHQFPVTNDGTDPSLWLASITRTGRTGGTQALPKVEFGGTRKPNRTDYNTAAAVPTSNKYRLTRITSETGGELQIAYGDSNCSPTALPNPDNNSMRCFPQYYAPPGSPGGWSWWNKYRVISVTERDLVGGSPDVVHSYGYSTTGSDSSVLWHHNDSDKWGLSLPLRTWSDWRGYSNVSITTGVAGSTRTRSEYRYFRGMHGDRTDAGETARTASITDSHGAEWTDYGYRAGQLLEQVDYDADATTPLFKHRFHPWQNQTGQRVEAAAHAQPTTTRSYFTDVAKEETFEFLPASGTWREREVEFVYDPTYGQVTKEIDRGLVGPTDDDTCTTTTYARNTNPAAWLIDYPAEDLVTNCADNPGPADVLSGERTYYDGSTTLGAAPTRGLDTRTDDLASYTGTTANWVTAGTATYDAYGRVRTETDALNRTTKTDYTPATGGPVTAETETNPAQHATTTQLDVRGQATTETDPNGKTTRAEYDPLGRLTKLWLPGRTTSQTPNTQYDYTVNGTAGPSHTRTRELGPNGNQISSYEIYDGLERPRQQQSTAPDGKRVISDLRYDARGLVSAETQFYNNASGPTGTLATFDDAAVDIQERSTYDALERPTETALWSRNAKKWATTTAYGGDRVTVTPPTGGTKTTTYLDVTGDVTRLQQHRGPGAQDPVDITNYGYDRLGQLTSITDPAGNKWTRTYDLRGRLTGGTDPDAGTVVNEYDDADQLTATTDGRGKKLWRKYDALGRVTELRDAHATGPLRATWTYDTLAKGELTSAVRHIGDKQYTKSVTGYTDLYDPTGSTVTIPEGHRGISGTYTTGYTYHPDGSPASVKYPAVADLPAETVTPTYTDAGDLASLAGTDTYLASATYAWHGGVTQRLLGSGGKRVRLIDSYEDSTLRRTKAQVSTERPGAADSFDEKLTERYSFDPSGNITAINEVNEAAGNTTVTQQCFQQDYLRRLTEAWTTTAATCQTSPTQAAVSGPDAYWQSFTYDLVGNRKTDTRHSPAGDTIRDYTTPAAGAAQPHTLTRRETRGGGPATSYTYDPGGYLKTRTTTAGTDTYTFDAEGLLSSLATAASGTHYYTYDADGTRLITIDPTAVTLELGHSEIRVDTTGKATGTRYYGDAVRTSADGLTWMISDHHGTGQLAINAATLTSTRRRTTPFGEARGPAAIWPDRKGFVGGTTDPTGLTHLGAREYDPTTGRFISVDPLTTPGDPQTLHAYAYANNNPISFSDPDGLAFDPRAGGGGGGLAAVPRVAMPSWNNIFRRTSKGSSSKGRGSNAKAKPGKTVTPRFSRSESRDAHNEKVFGRSRASRRSTPKPPKKIVRGPRAGGSKAKPQSRPKSSTKGAGGKKSGGRKVANQRPKNPAKPKPNAKPAPKKPKPDREDPSSDDCSGNSFTPDTRVLMADGSSKKIADIKVGDKVLATDPKTSRTEGREVTATHINDDRKFTNLTVRTSDGKQALIRTTQEHPFWDQSTDEWVGAGELTTAASLLAADNTLQRVIDVRSFDGRRTMYNLTVADIHTYYVLADKTPVLVHNCDREGLDFTDAEREKVYEANLKKNGGILKCEYCNITVVRRPSTRGVPGKPDDAQIDHREPRVLGGHGGSHNGAVSCRRCNRHKSTKPLWKWDAELRDLLD